MANASAPATAGKIVTVHLAPGALLAKADIAIPAYYPDLDLKEPNPIISIGHTDLTSTAVTVYNAGDYNAGLAATQFDVKNARTIRLGDATFALSLLELTYKAAGNIKRD